MTLEFDDGTVSLREKIESKKTGKRCGMKKTILVVLFVVIAQCLFAAKWKAINKIEVEVFTAEKTKWTMEYTLDGGIYRKISGLGRQTLSLNLKELDASKNDVMCSVNVEVNSFPTKDTLMGVALRIFRSGNIVEQVTGPACRTDEYAVNYWIKRYK